VSSQIHIVYVRQIAVYAARVTLKKQNFFVLISAPRLTLATSTLIMGPQIMARHFVRSSMNCQMRVNVYPEASITSTQCKELSLIASEPSGRVEEIAISKASSPLDTHPLNSTRVRFMTFLLFNHGLTFLLSLRCLFCLKWSLPSFHPTLSRLPHFPLASHPRYLPSRLPRTAHM
jgi:hypothetical protein